MKKRVLTGRFLAILSFFTLMSGMSFGQTVIIDPNLNGGFELGPTFADNGWTVVNTTNTGGPQWFLTQEPPPVLTSGAYTFTPTGNGAAYISNDAGVNWIYTNTLAGTSHFYRDVTFPAGETAINLSFRFNANGESTWDDIHVYLCPTTLTPVINQPSGNSTAPTWTGTGTPIWLGRYNLLAAGAGQVVTLPISPAITGNCAVATTWRLVFTWKNDTSGGTNPPAAIDDISLISAPNPIPLTGGNFTINNTLPTAGTNFQNFTLAIAALNAASACGPFTGPVVFNVSAGQTFAELPPVITATGNAAGTITFQKSGAGANPVITPTGTTGTTDAGISINGGDYFIFDGIDINASAVSNMEFGYRLNNASATNGAQFNTIKNFTVTMNRTVTASRGISMAIPSAPTAATGANSNNTFQNFTIKNVYAGIQMAGNATWPDLNTVIGTTNCTTYNTIGDPATSNDIGNATTTTYGISIQNASGFSVFNNIIKNVTNTGGQADGIVIVTFQGTSSVYNNVIQGIRNASTTSTTAIAGIRASHTTTGTHSLRIYNNAISNITSGYTGAASTTRTIKGIFINGTGGTTTQNYQIHNNSVSIDGSASLNLSSACFEISTTSGPVYNLSNNVFANFTATQTGVARHYGLVSTSATAFGPAGTTSLNNDIFIANDLGTTGFTGLGSATNYTSIANWSAAMTPAGQETGSIAANPGFISNSADLHPTSLALNASGTALQAYVTNDLECTARTDSDMGAYNLVACTGTPNAGTISGLTQLCANQNTTLSLTGASTEAGISYQWASSTTAGGPYTNMGTALSQATGAVPVTTYYVVTSTCSVSGLSATAAEFTLTANPLPTVAVSPTSGLICVPGGASIPLTASGTAVSYAWTPTAGLSATTGTSTVATPTGTTVYTVTGTDAIGCTNTATATINVEKNPAFASVTATPQALCANGSSQLQANAVIPSIMITEVTVFRTGTGATPTYPAYVTGQDLVEISNISSAPFDISGYTVSAYANNGATASHTVTLPAGTILPANGVAVICLGPGTDDIANRYFNTGGTSDSYSSSSQVGIVLKSGSSVVDAVGLGGSATGSYTFNAATGVTAGDWTGFAPNASGLAGVRRTVASDNNVGSDWTASGATNVQNIGTYNGGYTVPGTISYSWTPATYLDNTTISNPIASNVPSDITYTVTATSSTTCSSTSTITLTVQPLTSTATATPGTTICAGTSLTLNANPAGGGAPYTYAWTGPNGFTSAAQNPVIASPTLADAGTYSVLISDNCGGTTTSTVTITINALPVVAVSPTSAVYCVPGPAITLTASGASTYSWSPSAGLSATTGTSVDATPATLTTYTVTGTDGNGCISTATASVGNSVSVSVSGVTASPSVICSGDNSALVGTATLNATPAYCQPTYSTGTGSGDYVNSVVLNTLNNVSGASATPFYTLYPQSGTTTTTLAAGSTYTLTVGAGTWTGTGNNIAAWIDYNANGLLDDAGEKLGEVTNLGASPATGVITFTVPLTAYNGTLRLRVREVYAGTSITPCTNATYGETEDYNITVTGGVDPMTYAWTPATFLSSTNTASTTATAMTATTTYTLTATTGGGCTATGTATVTVNQPTTSTINPVACNTYTSPDGSVYTTSGTYTNVITNAAGCDSTITINLTVNNSTTSTINPVACDTYTSPDGSVYTTSGTYTNVITNAAGCDSTITINLTVNYSTTSTISPVVCDSYTAPDGAVYTANGTYTAIIPNAIGCDSVITIDLTVYGSSTSTINPVVCDTYTSPDGSVYTTSGTYVNTIPNFIGCDSVITINLTVNYTPAINAGSDVTVCQNGQVTLTATGGAVYSWTNGITNGVPFVATATNTYTVTGTSAAGCSATDAVTVTVLPLPTVDAGNNISQCGDQSVTLSGSGAFVYTWNNGVTDGVAFNAPFGTTSYIVTGVDAFGCSNTDIVTVTIGQVPAAVATAIDQLTISAEPANMFYQWIDCATGDAIFGATGSSYTASENGSYAVVVTSLDGCSDTSNCVVINSVGLGTLNKDQFISVYPNPTYGNAEISLSEIESVSVKVFDAQGKLVMTLENATDGTKLDLTNAEPGVYMIHFSHEGGSTVYRLVKE